MIRSEFEWPTVFGQAEADEEWAQHFINAYPDVLPEQLTSEDEQRQDEKRSGFSKELRYYYRPFANYLMGLERLAAQARPGKGFLVGVSGIQGTGKTTQGQIMGKILEELGETAYSLSIDDHYVTHNQLCKTRNKDPRVIRRGMTHDLALAEDSLRTLRDMGENDVVLTPAYYKGAHQGDGDRYRWVDIETDLTLRISVRRPGENAFYVNKVNRSGQGQLRVIYLDSVEYRGKQIALPDYMGSDIPIVDGFLPDSLISFLHGIADNVPIRAQNASSTSIRFSTECGSIAVPLRDLPPGWRVVSRKPHFIFYDGWMLLARGVEDERVFESGLPGLEDAEDVVFAKEMNLQLKHYERIWDEFINYGILLYVPDYHISVEWRDQAEQPLRERSRGMTTEQIREFVYYFWRSVHPDIQIRNLAIDEQIDHVVVIGNNHEIIDVEKPGSDRLHEWLEVSS